MSYKIQYFFIKIFINLLLMMPEKFRYKIAEVFGLLTFHLIKKRRVVTMANMKLAFPEKSEKELYELAKKNFKVSFKGFIASLWLKDFIDNEEKLASKEMREVFRETLEEGNGVVSALLHMGIIEGNLVGGREKEICTVAKTQRNPYLDELITKNREQFNVRVLKKGKSTSKDLMQYCKTNPENILGIFSDHRDKGAQVEFFGRNAISPTGSVFLALRYNKPILITYNVLRDDNTSKCYAKRFELVKTGDLKADVQTNTQALIKEFEKIILEHPEQWMWMHDRWKLAKELKKNNLL